MTPNNQNIPQNIPQKIAILGGKLNLIPQSERPTEDPFWLAASLPKIPENSTVLDAGCGNGIITLLLNHHFPNTHITALDNDPNMLAQAQQSAQLNACPATFIQASFNALPFKDKSFHWLVTNPPYHPNHQTPNARTQAIRTLPQNALETWLTEFNRTAHHCAIMLHSQSLPQAQTWAKNNNIPLKIIHLKSHVSKPAKRIILQTNLTGQHTINTYQDDLRQKILHQGLKLQVLDL